MSDNEILDIVNEKDEVIGTATRKDCHSNPHLIHRTVHFTLVDPRNKKVLMTIRSRKKKHDGGKYCVLGEHILSGKTYIDAIKRGVNEELGFVPQKFKELSHNIFTYDNQREFVRFFIILWNNEQIKYDTSEIEDLVWVDIDKIVSADLDYSDMTRYWIKTIKWSDSM